MELSKKAGVLGKPRASADYKYSERDQKNRRVPISDGVSCSRRRRGSYAAVGIERASHRMLLRMDSEPFSSIGLLTMSGCCVEQETANLQATHAAQCTVTSTLK